MKVAFRASFHRDLKKVNDKDILQKVKEHIHRAEEANSLAEIAHIKKISGSRLSRKGQVHPADAEGSQFFSRRQP